MVQFSQEIQVQAAPEAVFDELSDLRHEMRWSAKMRSVRLLSEEPVGVGSRFRARWAGSPENDVVYREYDRPVRWVTESSSWLLVVVVTFGVSPTSSGSRLTSTWDLRPRGPVRLLTPLLKKAFATDVAASMRAAKHHVELLPST